MNRLPLLLAVLLVAAAAWLLLRPPEDGAFDDPPAPDRPPPSEGPGASLVGQGPARGGSDDPTLPPGGRAPGMIDPRTLPRGPLEVHVLTVDEQPIPSEAVTVEVGAAAGLPVWHEQPLLRPDPAGHAWKGEDVFAGRVRVRVWGDHVVEQSVETVVETGPTPPLRVLMEAGGSIEYTAALLDGAEPSEVRVSLTGARRVPVVASYQVRTQEVLTTPRRAAEVVQGPRGVIFGLRPGTYRLEAASMLTGESGSSEVTVEAGKTARVALRLLR